MSNQLVKYATATGEVALDKQTIKNYLVSGDSSKVTDQELELFLNLCKYQKLNPFLRDAYLVKFGTAPANIIVGKDFFIKRAYASEEFKGYEAGVIVLNKDNEIIERPGSFYAKEVEKLVGGWVKVFKKDGTEFYHTVAFDEYNSNQSTWKKIPATMIRKVALVQALREAFPEEFQGLYDSGEMGVEEVNLSQDDIDTSIARVNREQFNHLLEVVDLDIIKAFCKEKGYRDANEITVSEYHKFLQDFENIKNADYEEVDEEELNEEDLPF